MKPTRKVLIIGASTGIGAALVRCHLEKGNAVIACSRHPESVLSRFENKCIEAYSLDFTQVESARETLTSILQAGEPVNTAYIVSGTGDIEEILDFESVRTTLSINCNGFTLAAYLISNALESQRHGHLVGITSVAAVRGASAAPMYNASKAFQRSLLEGLRIRFKKSGLAISVTEVRPGFVDTEMMKADKPFWVCSPKKAALQITSAVERKRETVYVSKRWRLIGVLLQLLPTFIYDKIA